MTDAQQPGPESETEVIPALTSGRGIARTQELPVVEDETVQPARSRPSPRSRPRPGPRPPPGSAGRPPVPAAPAAPAPYLRRRHRPPRRRRVPVGAGTGRGAPSGRVLAARRRDRHRARRGRSGVRQPRRDERLRGVRRRPRTRRGSRRPCRASTPRVAAASAPRAAPGAPRPTRAPTSATSRTASACCSTSAPRRPSARSASTSPAVRHRGAPGGRRALRPETGYARVTGPASASGATWLAVKDGGQHRYWLVWVTKLAAQDGGYRAVLSTPVVRGTSAGPRGGGAPALP